jgi:hypothetical protein
MKNCHLKWINQKILNKGILFLLNFQKFISLFILLSVLLILMRNNLS